MNTWDIFDIILSVLDVLLHIICFYLMHRFNQRKRYLFLVSLLASETIFSIGNIINLLFEYTIPNVGAVVGIAIFLVNIPYCGSLILISLEKFFEVYLNIRYYPSCFYRSRILLCLLLWILAAILTSCVVVLAIIWKSKWMYIQNIYYKFLIPMHCIILTTFIIVFGYIYAIVVLQRRKIQRNEGACHIATNTSKLFFPFLVVLGFICFMTIPTFLQMYIIKSPRPIWVLICNRLYSTCTALGYLSFQPVVVNRMFRLSKRKVSIPTAVVVRDENNAVREMYTF